MRKILYSILLFAFSFCAIAEDFKTDEKGFIRDWILGGAYPSYQKDGKPLGFTEDFLTSMGGEANAEPRAGMKEDVEFKADKAKLIAGIGSTNEWGWTETKTLPVIWKDIHWTQGRIMLDKMFLPVDDHMVAYAFCYINSPEKRKIKVRVGSDDDHKIWLNGKMIGSVNKSQGVVPDNFIYEAQLERGLNRLLMKIVDRTHDFGYCVALSDMADKPMSDVKIVLEHPRAELLKKVKNLGSVDAWDNGFYAGFIFASKHVFAGKNDVNIQYGSPEDGTFKLELTMKSGSKILFKETKETALSASLASDWKISTEIPAGKILITLNVYSGDKLCSSMNYNLDVYDLEKIRERNKELPLLLSSKDKQIKEAEEKGASIRANTEELQKTLATIYESMEKAYAENRAVLRSNPAAVDEPLKAASVERQLLCLNGDNWAMADGVSGEAKGGYTPPAADKYVKVNMPVTCFNEYFRTWFYPVKGEAYGKVEPCPGWEGFVFNKLLCSKKLWYKTELDLGNVSGKSFRMRFDNVEGKLKLFVNGTFCGEYSGWMGQVVIPLKAMRDGQNSIEAYVEKLNYEADSNSNMRWGIGDDIWFETAPSVNLCDIEVKTSWRKASIDVLSELENAGSKEAKIRLDQYCVLDKKIKYRLPAKELTIAPYSKASTSLSGIWTEAENWGIGGKYGNPVLYDLVTDIYLDGKLVDRQLTPFGFREFWIAGTDFFLNGKRIILQGDVGLPGLNNRKWMEVVFPLLRADGINIIRNHDGAMESPEFLRSCDKMGMLAYVQFHPIIHDKKQPSNFAAEKPAYSSFEEWMKNPVHQDNLRNYENWVKMLRNHPSVVIASTDNEIFTQAWDTAAREDYNIRNDRIGAFYGRYVKSLNPALIITRDGDEGTWGHKGKWHENPPCDTGNYHYPDFNIEDFVLNWQSVYDFRPAVFGETLYCSYGAWDKWIGPVPSQVQKKAATVRSVASLYKKLGIPAQIYMGLSSDGFIKLDDSGKGNPWGITASAVNAYKDKKALPEGLVYPWRKIEWPSLSGKGMKRLAQDVAQGSYGHKALNWFDSKYASHVRNEVNDAYRDSLIPQPALAVPSDAEFIVDLGSAGAGKLVSAIHASGLYPADAVVADSAGKVWFEVSEPGKYKVSCGDKTILVDVPGKSGYYSEPGFDKIPRFKMEK